MYTMVVFRRQIDGCERAIFIESRILAIAKQAAGRVITAFGLNDSLFIDRAGLADYSVCRGDQSVGIEIDRTCPWSKRSGKNWLKFS